MLFKCPVCSLPLLNNNHSLECANHHHFDYNKHHIINLALSQKRKTQGDDLVMSLARHQFLLENHYLPLANTMIKLVKPYNINNIIDCGGGQGYYLDQIASILNIDPNNCYALDLSQKLLRLGQKHYQKYHWVVANIKKLPILDNSVDLAINAFVPLFIDEIERVLKKDGLLLFVEVGYFHLSKLKQILYSQIKYNNRSLFIYHSNLKRIVTDEIKFEINLSQEQIQNLLKMTPYYYKTSKKAIDNLKNYNSLMVDCHFVLHLFQKII